MLPKEINLEESIENYLVSQDMNKVVSKNCTLRFQFLQWCRINVLKNVNYKRIHVNKNYQIVIILVVF